MPSLNFNVKNGLSIGVGSTILNTANSNIGIGVFNPTSKLQVAGTVAATNFSGSGSSLSNIPNTALTNSSVTISTSSGLSGGGTLSLGGSLTLTNTGVTSLAASGSGLSLSASTGSVTATINSSSSNTPSTLVFRDASGNFSAGTITANLTGTASNATLASNVVGSGGQVLYNSSSNTTTTSSNLVFNGTQLGIGKSPSFTLDVGGDINFTGTFYQNGSQFIASRWTSGTGTSIYRLSNVGIGTSTPTQALHVSGNARITGSLIDSNNGTGTTWQTLQSTGTGTTWGMRVYTEKTYDSIGIGTSSLANFVTSGDPLLNWIANNFTTNYFNFPGTIVQDTKNYGIRYLSNYTPQIASGKVPTNIPTFTLYIVGGLPGNSIYFLSYTNLITTQIYDFDNTTVFQIPTSDIGGTLPLQFTLDKTKFPPISNTNIGIGKVSLFQRTSGFNNIAIGGFSLYNSTSGNNNISIGANSLFTSTTGNNNIAIGANSLSKLTTGGSNLCVGGGSGTGIINGTNNTILGFNAFSSGNASFCTILGNQAGIAKGSGNYDVGIGYRSIGYAGTTGTLGLSVQNGGTGYIDGTYNIQFLYNSYTATSNNANTYSLTATVVVSGGVIQSATLVSWSGGATPQVGDLLYPFFWNTTSLNPGYGAILSVSSVSLNYLGNNTAVGSFALTNLRTGGYNTTLGYSAGSGITTGSQNLLLGYQAGTSLTTESNNVIIGGNNGSGLVGLSNNILIADGAGNERIRIDSNGNVNISRSTDAMVNIKTSSTSGSNYALSRVSSSDGVYILDSILYGNGGAYVFTNGNGLNLGCSSNSPVLFWTNNTERLRIDSSGNTSIGVNTAVAGSNTYRLLSSVPGTSALYQLGLQYPSVATYGFTVNSSGDLFIAEDGVERLRLDTNGNLGLGVVPSAWSLGGPAIQLVGGASFVGNNSRSYINANTYWNGSNWLRIAALPVVQQVNDHNSGSFVWNVAPTGTAGSTVSFTSAMTLDSSSNLSLAGTFTLSNRPFFRNVPTISSNYTITTSFNEMSIGPITINSGITVEIQSGATWTIV